MISPEQSNLTVLQHFFPRWFFNSDRRLALLQNPSGAMQMRTLKATIKRIFLSCGRHLDDRHFEAKTVTQ